MKLNIIAARCQGHAMCLIACPELFALREHDGHAYLLSIDVPEHLVKNVRDAELSCPERAIEILD